MLIRIIDGDQEKFELIEHTFDSHLKLLLRSQDKTLPAGKYIIVVAPQWNDEASISPSFKKVTTGIYAPVQRLKLKPLANKLGYTAMAQIFSEMSAKK